MKELIIGIDGGTAWIFDFFNMPFWSELKSKGKLLPIKEDILQRGWARMLSGQRATENASFYVRPKLDGSRNFTISYGFKELSKQSEFKPIWSFAEAKGKKIGLMNIPTTFPSQKVEGFHVSGGGGGVYSGSMPAGSLYPEDAGSILARNNYIFDVRLGQQRFENAEVLCNHLDAMTERRTRTFIELSEKFDIDFGFLAYRGPTVLMYLAMSEIMALSNPEESKKWVQKEALGSKRMNWRNPLFQHFKVLDDSLRLLFQNLAPENYMIVSDHSIVPWRYKGDLNAFAVKKGFAIRENVPLTTMRNVARFALRAKFRSTIEKISKHQRYSFMTSAGAKVSDASKLFGVTYINGLYVNDQRFKGSVTDSERVELVDEFLEQFNADPEATSYGLRALAYRRQYLNDKHADSAPDVKIAHPGEFFFTDQAGCFLRNNEHYGAVDSLSDVPGMYTGQKGDAPLLLVNSALAALVKADDELDLRLIHTLTQRLFT